MFTEDQEETRERYRKRWEAYGYDSRTLGWNKDCQWVRFAAIFEGLRPEEFGSVLDVGCGFGDLYGYLRELGWKGHYCGVDLVEELVGEARRRYAADENAEFRCGDVEEVSLPGQYDLAAAIGIFNHGISGGNLAFIRGTFEKMWNATRQVVVCDFLSDSADPDRRQENLFYADPRQMYELAAGRSRRVMIHHAYMPFEFQVKAWHDAAFEIPAPVFRPYRHLAAAQTEWRRRAGGA